MKSSDVTGMLDVGFGNTFPRHRVVGIVAFDSDPMRRHCQELENLNKVIDATRGRKTRSVVFLDSDHVVLSMLTHDTLAERFQTLWGKSEQLEV